MSPLSRRYEKSSNRRASCMTDRLDRQISCSISCLIGLVGFRYSSICCLLYHTCLYVPTFQTKFLYRELSAFLWCGDSAALFHEDCAGSCEDGGMVFQCAGCWCLFFCFLYPTTPSFPCDGYPRYGVSSPFQKLFHRIVAHSDAFTDFHKA